jgi:hypothetical protein
VGTDTTIFVLLAELTAARTAPKYTILFVAIGSKLNPEMVTVVPFVPERGLKLVMAGIALTASGALELTTLPNRLLTTTE